MCEEEKMNDVVSWHSPSGLKAAMDDLCAHMDTCRSLLIDSSESVPSAELVGALYAVDVKMRTLLELMRKGFSDEAYGEMGRRTSDREDQPWRGQESGRGDHVPESLGCNPRYLELSRAKAQAKAAFARGRRSRPRRRKGRR